jgi:hypothetical protein
MKTYCKTCLSPLEVTIQYQMCQEAIMIEPCEQCIENLSDGELISDGERMLAESDLSCFKTACRSLLKNITVNEQNQKQVDYIKELLDD